MAAPSIRFDEAQEERKKAFIVALLMDWPPYSRTGKHSEDDLALAAAARWEAYVNRWQSMPPGEERDEIERIEKYWAHGLED